MPELFNQLDHGIALCEIDSLSFAETNPVFRTWLEAVSGNNLLANFVDENTLKRINKAIVKQRIFRFEKNILIGRRNEHIEFCTKLITAANNKTYLLIESVINNSVFQIEEMVKEHSKIAAKNQLLLEQAIEKSESANVAKSIFLASMSHELRTPMNGILGMAQQMFKSSLTSDQTSLLHTIEHSGDQLLSIINQALYFSKIEANEIELHTESINLKSLINDIVAICANVDNAENVNIKTDITTEKLPNVLTDDARLKQVLINLVNNAVKFTENGTVTVEISLLEINEQQCKLKFSVIDTGVGIHQDRIDHLFEAFSQHDASTTRDFGGTGLGLTISDQLIDLSSV